MKYQINIVDLRTRNFCDCCNILFFPCSALFFRKQILVHQGRLIFFNSPNEPLQSNHIFKKKIAIYIERDFLKHFLNKQLLSIYGNLETPKLYCSFGSRMQECIQVSFHAIMQLIYFELLKLNIFFFIYLALFQSKFLFSLRYTEQNNTNTHGSEMFKDPSILS